MIDLQKQLMQLVKEVDEGCKKLEIPYALGSQTAGFAMEYKKFINETCEFHVMMLAKDALRLKEYLLNNGIEDRGIEDLSTNPELAGNEIRYVNTATTFIDREDPVIYELMGVCVTIHPLYIHEPSKYNQMLEGATLYLNAGKEYNRFYVSKMVNLAIKITKTCYKTLGKKWVASQIYGMMKKQKDTHVTDTLYFRDENGRLLKISSKAILKTRDIVFEGMSLPVSQEKELFFQEVYGNGWEECYTEPTLTSKRVAVIRDANRSYVEWCREWKENGFQIEDIKRENREHFLWQCENVNLWKTKTGRTYANAKRSVDRIDLYCYYRDKMEMLERAAKYKDIERLREIMEPYLVCTRRYLKKYNMGFYINDTLFSYAKMIWEFDGREKMAERVYERVPQVYREEDVGEYLAKHGF